MTNRAQVKVGPRQLPLMLKVALPGLVFSAFLTEMKFIPGIRNNIGPFEVLGWAIGLAVILVYRPLRMTPVTRLVAAILLVASLSLVNLAPHRLVPAIVQIGVLLFLLVFLVTMQNLGLRFRISPGYFLLLVTLSVAVIGPWILVQGLQSAGHGFAVGPFRNRVHMGNYMLTAFWMVVMYSFWPNRHRGKKLLCSVGVLLTLYTVAISGRRSLYLSAFFGLAGLSVAFLVARGRRIRMAWIAIFAIGSMAGLYRYGGDVLPRLDFFRSRIVMVDDRLKSALGISEEEAMEKSFLVLQRAGVMKAFRDHPILGIGWAGFGKTEYSPTGHEVHSTPLRFLAETGLTGLTLYVWLMLYLLMQSARMFLRMRNTIFGASYLIQAIALWSLFISYLYNRHITERTFYLLLAVYLIMEAMAARSAHSTGTARALGSSEVLKPGRRGRPIPVAVTGEGETSTPWA